MENQAIHHRFGILQWLFLAGIPLGTFIILPTTGAGWVLPKLLLFALLGCLTGGLLLIRRERLILPFGGIPGWFLLAYIVVLLLSPLWSIAPVPSILGASPRFFGLLAHLVVLTIGYASFLLSLSPEGRRTVLIAILFSHIGVVLYGLLQIISLDSFARVWEQGAFLGRPFSTIGQPNALGSFLLLTTPFISLSALQSRGITRWWQGMFALAGILLLLLTASRAASLGLGVAILLALISRWSLWKETMTQRRLVFLGIVTLMVLAIGGFAFRERFAHPTEVGRSSSVRLLVWSKIPAMMQERPQGYGLESLGLVFPHFFRPEIYAYEKLTAGVDRAHSMPLDLLLALGPVGLFSFLGFLLLLLMAVWRKRQDDLSLMCLLAVAGYGTSLFFGFETVVTGVFFWIVVGMIAASLQREGEMRMLRPGASFVVAVAMTALTAATLVVSLQWTRARMAMHDAEALFQEGKRIEAMQGYLRARGHFPFDREILVQGAETALLTMERTGDAELRSSLQSVAESMVAQSLRLSRDQDGMGFLLRAWLFALMGERERMEEDIMHARELQPLGMATHRIAAHSYALLGMREEEKQAKQTLRDLLPLWWRDQSSERGRILWKENPWLADFLPSDDSPP